MSKPKPRTGTREEWRTARLELLKAEKDRAPLGRNETEGIAGGIWYHDEYGKR